MTSANAVSVRRGGCLHVIWLRGPAASIHGILWYTVHVHVARELANHTETPRPAPSATPLAWQPGKGISWLHTIQAPTHTLTSREIAKTTAPHCLAPPYPFLGRTRPMVVAMAGAKGEPGIKAPVPTHIVAPLPYNNMEGRGPSQVEQTSCDLRPMC